MESCNLNGLTEAGHSDLLGCFQVDHQLKVRRLLNGQLGGPGAVAYKSSVVHGQSGVDRGYPAPCCELRNESLNVGRAI